MPASGKPYGRKTGRKKSDAGANAYDTGMKMRRAGAATYNAMSTPQRRAGMLDMGVTSARRTSPGVTTNNTLDSRMMPTSSANDMAARARGMSMPAKKDKLRQQYAKYGIQMSDADVVASQKASAKKMTQSSARDSKRSTASKPKPASNTSTKSSVSRGGRVGSPSAGGSMNTSTTKKSSGMGGVASTVAAAAGGLAAGKVVTSVANRGSRVGSPSNAARGNRPAKSGRAGRAGENFGRQIRTGAAGSGQYGRPSPSGRNVGRGSQAGSPSKKGRTVAGQTNPMKGRGGTSGKPKGN
jgi:hypothetical protein